MELCDLASARASSPMKESLRHFAELLGSNRADEGCLIADTRILPQVIFERKVLQALKLELAKIDDSDVLFPEAREAIQVVVEKDADLELVAACVMLRLGRLDQCTQHVLNYLGRVGTQLPEEVSGVLVDACLFLSWGQWPSPHEALLESATTLDRGGAFHDKIEAYRQLTSARQDFDEGEYRAAARQSYQVTETASEMPGIKAFALELMADCCNRLGDLQRELEILEDWSQLFATNPHGPAGEAARQAQLRTTSGQERAKAILAKYSRLALLLEQELTYRPKALEIYDDFIACWCDDYVDPDAAHLGTIQDRRGRLAPGPTSDVDDVTTTGKRAMLVGSLPVYSRAEDDAQMLKKLYEAAPGSGKAVVIGSETLKESLYSFDPDKGEPDTQLLQSMRHAASGQSEPASFSFDLMQVVYQQDSERWIWAQLNAGGRSIRPIRLGVRLVRLGARFQTEVLILYQLPEGLANPDELDSLAASLRKLDTESLGIVMNPFIRTLRDAARSLDPQGGYGYV